jgi:hypothetical protein
MAPVTGLTSRQQLFAVLAVLALFVRLLVPAGFMPQVAGGQVAIVACPGVVASAPHGHGHDAPGHDGFERPCAFAAVAAAATIMAVAMLLALPLAPRVPRAVRPVAARRVHAALRWRPPLRAPPTTPSIR